MFNDSISNYPLYHSPDHWFVEPLDFELLPEGSLFWLWICCEHIPNQPYFKIFDVRGIFGNMSLLNCNVSVSLLNDRVSSIQISVIGGKGHTVSDSLLQNSLFRHHTCQLYFIAFFRWTPSCREFNSIFLIPYNRLYIVRCLIRPEALPKLF